MYRMRGTLAKMRDFEKDEMLIDLVRMKQELYDLSSPLYSDNNAKRDAWKEIAAQLKCTAIQCKNRWEQLRAQHRKQIIKNKTYKWKYEDQMAFLKVFMKIKPRMFPLNSEGQEEMEYQQNETEQHTDTNVEDDIDEDDHFVKVEKEEHDRNLEYFDESESRDSQDGTVGKKTVAKPRKFIQPQPKPTAPPPLKQVVPESMMKVILEEKKENSNKEQQENNPLEIDQFFSLMGSTVKKFNLLDQHIVKRKIFNLVSEIEAKYLFEPFQNVQFPATSTSPTLYSNATQLSSLPSLN